MPLILISTAVLKKLEFLRFFKLQNSHLEQILLFFFPFPITDNLNNVLKYILNNVIYLEYLITLRFSLRIISFEIRSIINANLLGKKYCN